MGNLLGRFMDLMGIWGYGEIGMDSCGGKTLLLGWVLYLLFLFEMYVTVMN
jgi:hypothetical protein